MIPADVMVALRVRSGATANAREIMLVGQPLGLCSCLGSPGSAHLGRARAVAEDGWRKYRAVGSGGGLGQVSNLRPGGPAPKSQIRVDRSEEWPGDLSQASLGESQQMGHLS